MEGVCNLHAWSNQSFDMAKAREKTKIYTFFSGWHSLGMLWLLFDLVQVPKVFGYALLAQPIIRFCHWLLPKQFEHWNWIWSGVINYWFTTTARWDRLTCQPATRGPKDRLTNLYVYEELPHHSALTRKQKNSGAHKHSVFQKIFSQLCLGDISSYGESIASHIV